MNKVTSKETEWFINQAQENNKIYQKERDDIRDEIHVYQYCGSYIEDLINHLQKIKIRNSTYSLKLISELKIEFELIPAPYIQKYEFRKNNEDE